MRKHAPFFAAAALLALLCFASVAAAQTVDVNITSASTTINSSQPPLLRLEGPEAVIYLSWSNFMGWNYCFPCLVSDPIRIRDGESAPDLRGRYASIYGNEFASLYYDGYVQLEAPTIYLKFRQIKNRFHQPVPLNIPPQTIPATLTGSLVAYRRSNFGGEGGTPVFQTTLNLRGTVTVHFRIFDFRPSGEPIYQTSSVDYNFPAGMTNRPPVPSALPE
ncbi:MAG: hypothetical protein JO360_08180 [Acidobacteria bacterium]|nr:hypothetical protein [Acidobacteriota bacterium]